MPGCGPRSLDFQRAFAARPEGAVLDGRDIGTAVCPDADVKIFVTASPEVRARRRTDELAAKGRDVDYERILAEISGRDARDSGRAAAPLKAAADAYLLDTSDKDIEAAFRAAVDIVDRARADATDGSGAPGRAGFRLFVLPGFFDLTAASRSFAGGTGTADFMTLARRTAKRAGVPYRQGRGQGPINANRRQAPPAMQECQCR